MHLEPFEYFRPATVLEACELLEESGPDAVIYAGGTELVLLMKLGLAAPTVLVDCKHLESLRETGPQDDGSFRIGGATTHHEISQNLQIRHEAPVLADLAGSLGNSRVRTVGTLGGNLCFADPRSDPATLLLALDAQVELAGRLGTRFVNIDEFLSGALVTSIGASEVLTSVRFRRWPPGRLAYTRHAPRERPEVTAALATDGGRGTRLVIGAVSSTPVRVPEVEAILNEDPENLGAIYAAVTERVVPFDSTRGSMDYQRHVAGTIAKRLVATWKKTPQ